MTVELLIVAVIVTSCGFFLTGHREVAYALHVTDDTGQVVNVLTVTFRAFMQVVLADVSAFVADCVRDIECKVITSLLSSNTKKLRVLCLCQVLLEIQVKS
jgi:hypothetical protein